MGAVGDVYQVLVRATRGGGVNQILNVFFYRMVQAGLGAAELGNQFHLIVYGDMRDCLGTGYNGERIEVANLFDPTDFDVVDTSGENGLLAGTMMPSFVCSSFQCIRKRLDMRHGWKRLGPITEEVCTGDTYTAAYELACDDLRDRMGYTLQEAAADAFEPVIVKRIKEEPVPGKFTYRLPENQGELVYYVADTWLLRPPTTQNTRKAGRGV